MRILVTGASGFIGGHVVSRLAADGHEVVATGRDAARLARLRQHRCELIPAELSSDTLQPIVRGCEAIVHCAALAAPWGRREDFVRSNVLATERLLEAAVATPTLRRFVFLSSPSIYFRPADQERVTEDFSPPARWATHYAESKWAAECRVLQAKYRSVGPVILRPRAVFGPGDTAIVPRLLQVARRGSFPLVNGGRAWIDVTYVDNAVDAVVRALGAGDAAVGRAFNVTNDEPVQVRDLLTRLFAALRLDVRFVNLPRAAAVALAALSESLARLVPNQPEPRLTRYGVGLLAWTQTLSIDAARTVLGYQPIVSVQDGLQRYARWCADHD